MIRSRVESVWDCPRPPRLVEAQPGDNYGGWITPSIVGPFTGGPGTRGW